MIIEFFKYLFNGLILICSTICTIIYKFVTIPINFVCNLGDKEMKINDNNIIDKIIKLKFNHRNLYKFAKKLDKDNISFLSYYVVKNLNCWEKLDVTERHLYNKIKYIIISYNLINKSECL